jgi:hypothetical protein
MALEQLRAFRSGAPQESLGAVRRLEPDGFPLLESSELGAAHERLGPLIERLARSDDVSKDSKVAELIAEDTAVRTALYVALIERTFAQNAKLSSVRDYTFSHFFDYGGAASFLALLLDAGVDAERVIEPTLAWFTSYRFVYYGVEPLTRVLDLIAAHGSNGGLPARVRELLIAVHAQCSDLGRHHAMSGELIARLTTLLGSGSWEVLPPCEVWTAAVTREIEALPEAQRKGFLGLLSHCATASAARPSDKWLKTRCSSHRDARFRGFSGLGVMSTTLART